RQTYSRLYPFREPETCSGHARSEGGGDRLLLELRLHGQRARVPTTCRPRFSERQALCRRNSGLGGRRLSARRGSRESDAIRLTNQISCRTSVSLRSRNPNAPRTSTTTRTRTIPNFGILLEYLPGAECVQYQGTGEADRYIRAQ